MKKRLSIFLSIVTTAFIMVGCSSQPQSKAKSQEQSTAALTASVKETKKPKYVFMFIGDGMSHVQINAAQILNGNKKSGEIATKNLKFTRFPVVGSATTHDSTSFCPDSASTATAYSTGEKTHSGVLGMKVDKKTVAPTITEQLKKEGKKIGIISNVSLDHATPAAYYAHSESRNNYYDISLQLAKSNFDYFAGGELKQPKGKQKDKEDAYGIIEKSGYKIARTKEEIQALNSSSGKVYAISPVLQDSGAMPYTIDEKEGDLTLADFVKKGTEVLENDKGFFLMCESGKIDWACHANDAMSAIEDVLAFDKAIDQAVEFAKKHPDETLIIVTGDHETGGMTIGYATTGYNTAFDILKHQKMSYVAFDDMFSKMKKNNPSISFEKIMPIITEKFGLIAPNDIKAKEEKNKEMVLTESEFKKLKDGFAETMKASDKRSKSDDSYVLYGSYEPLSVSLTHILNNKAGIGWTSYSHTGTPVPVYAYGVGAKKFNGSYDNTDVYKKLIKLCK
ncbi:alkaline phosphatase [Hathewaya proteolytica DSM 3090]|uniref:Alkaline phosphatase n=1 Tax=Hathewaya proteolytica DSM 3090 TaxID=1121331 RepID=A0A1M6NXQ3_9CLOT|nr:alkaline phosphatase [Hathewaya proteolytica DSM 3090]